jgi:RNA polymerase sigma-70 factor, ECF subfamily
MTKRGLPIGLRLRGPAPEESSDRPRPAVARADGAARRFPTIASARGMSDDALMQLASDGTRSAFDELIRRHEARAIGIALRHTGALALAQEIAQEAFVDVFKSLSRYRAHGKFSAFLSRIVINRCRMEFRRRRWYETGGVGRDGNVEQREDTTSLDLMLARERERRLALEIQGLSKPLRDVVTLWGEGLKDKEIAAALRTPVGTVRRRRFDALERLHARLEQDEIELQPEVERPRARLSIDRAGARGVENDGT